MFGFGEVSTGLGNAITGNSSPSFAREDTSFKVSRIRTKTPGVFTDVNISSSGTRALLVRPKLATLISTEYLTPNLEIDSEIETTTILDKNSDDYCDYDEYDIINKNIYISYKYNNNLFNIKLNYQIKRPHDHEFRSISSYCISINNKINTGNIFNKILQYCNYDINQVVDTNVYNQYYNTIGVNTTKLEKLITNLL